MLVQSSANTCTLELRIDPRSQLGIPNSKPFSVRLDGVMIDSEWGDAFFNLVWCSNPSVLHSWGAEMKMRLHDLINRMVVTVMRGQPVCAV